MTSLADWADFWEGLRPDVIARLYDLCAPDVRFIDPFNDISGAAGLESLLRHMFLVVREPRFVVEDLAMGDKAGYLRWRFEGLTAGRPVSLEGMSEVRFTTAGLISLHRDHWDAGSQVYGRIPLLGAAIRLVKAKFRAPVS